MQTNKSEKSCGAILYCREGSAVRYLLIRQHNSMLFGFPKGHVEGRESEQETALREIFEEVGLTPELDSGFRREIHYPLPQKAGVTKYVVFFLAEIAPDCAVTIQPSEVAEYRFATYEQALPLLHDNVAAVLQEANALLCS